MSERIYTLADVRAVSERLQKDADDGFRQLGICNPYWIGSVWHCRTHDRYIEDGDVCPKAEGP